MGMRGNLCLRRNSRHDRVDATFIRITFEHDGFYSTDAQTACAGLPCCGNLNSLGISRVSPTSWSAAARTGVAAAGESRNVRTRLTVYTGLSSISQCPERGTTASLTLIA